MQLASATVVDMYVLLRPLIKSALTRHLFEPINSIRLVILRATRRVLDWLAICRTVSVSGLSPNDMHGYICFRSDDHDDPLYKNFKTIHATLIKIATL